MNKLILVAVVWGCVALSAQAGSVGGEIKLRDSDLDGLLVNNGEAALSVEFDVKREDILDEVTFEFYMLLYPRDKEAGPQFFHCRTVHRYLEEKTGYKSGAVLSAAILNVIEPRDSKYAIVATYKGKEVGVENSEDDRWWEDASLGAPVENLLRRFAEVPIVREWESGK